VQGRDRTNDSTRAAAHAAAYDTPGVGSFRDWLPCIPKANDENRTMFTDGTERRDWIFGFVITAVIIGGVVWLERQSPREQQLEAKLSSEALEAPSAAPDPEPHVEWRIPVRTRQPELRTTPRSGVIARVYECDGDNQRVLSDQPCAVDAAVRDVAAPNRMIAQDTRVLYEQAYRPRPPQPPSRTDRRYDHRVEICRQIERDIDRINARMRRGYSSWEGELFRESLRQLSKARYDARCIR
jgi:hypothetical protein